MSEKKLFSIGDVVRLFHISVSSLRHYENVGLLAPEYTDSSSGYRYYSVERIEGKIDNRLKCLKDAQTAELSVISLVTLSECRMVWVEDSLKIEGFLDMEAPIRKPPLSTADF